MKHILDMVHENPGEAPFATSFRDPATLVSLGYNGQVFKHLNTVITFDTLGLNCFPAGSEAREWLKANTARIEKEIHDAKAADLKILYHLDLFVLPCQLVEVMRKDICDPKTGKISLKRKKTLEVHRVMFDEMFEHFPQVDGIIIRVGETYLYDTPFHTGNGAVPNESSEMSTDEKEQFVTLLNFLRQTVCVRHNRTVLFRTWDCHPTRFHANRNIYLELTNQVEPHELLLFSIKHTALDFWRWVKFNPCLGAGKHEQVVEVQCQREYEGKGAYPCYIMHHVINGFEEHLPGESLSSLVTNPLVQGLYTWSRGGGWYGPYLPNEFWPRLNAYVISHWFNDSSRSEENIFHQFACEEMGLSQPDAETFRILTLLAEEANLYGHYCNAFDTQRSLSTLPTNNWMRDDHLGGLEQLKPVFEYLNKHDCFDQALAEKARSVTLWKQASDLYATLSVPDAELGEFIGTSITYGLRLFTLIEAGWRVMAIDYQARHGKPLLPDELRKALNEYDRAYVKYQELTKLQQAASLYKDNYWAMPEHPPQPGLGASVSAVREQAVQAVK